MSNCENCGCTSAASDGTEPQTCPAVGYQRVGVCVPVTVTPFAETGTVVTHCCGDPVISSGAAPCGGKKNGTCTFTVSQTYV